MITLTQRAAEQVKYAAEEGGMAGLALRLAVKKNPDDSLDYGMGFDEPKDDDLESKSHGVEIIYAAAFGPLLEGMEIDYVEYQPGDYRFIFLNPNDANYTPPTEEAGGA
jgi:iron-sulfur cluster assembly protein